MTFALGTGAGVHALDSPQKGKSRRRVATRLTRAKVATNRRGLEHRLSRTTVRASSARFSVHRTSQTFRCTQGNS
jgi:hypothetical protein